MKYACMRFGITAGAEWNQRVAYNLDKTLFNPDARVLATCVWRVQTFGKFTLHRRRGDEYKSSTFNTLTHSADPLRVSVWGAFNGLKGIQICKKYQRLLP